jgi:branched-subunit amino acid ABC-type transport system permease component
VILASAGQEAVQQLINALSLGSTYALLALGLAMVFSILGLVNFAHGELVTIAAYTMYFEHQKGFRSPCRLPRRSLPRASRQS